MKKSTYAVVAAAMLAAIVMPVAFAGAAGGAKTSASVNKQLRVLKQRIAALEGKQSPTTLPPSGPAGGALTGTYPNPQIKTDAVGATQIKADAVGSEEIADSAVNTGEIVDFSVHAADMGADSVGSFALKGVHAVVSPVGTAIADEASGSASVTCPAGEMVIGGGFAWTDKEANSVIASAPSEANPNTTWVVEGIPHAGSNTLYAWANCLAS